MGKGYTLLQENMYYTFVDNVFTIWAGYTQKYAAFDYNVRILTSREGKHILVSFDKTKAISKIQ